MFIQAPYIDKIMDIKLLQANILCIILGRGSVIRNVQYTGIYTVCYIHTLPKVIDFPRYNMIYSGENVILRRIFHVVSCFLLHFILNCENWIILF